MLRLSVGGYAKTTAVHWQDMGRGYILWIGTWLDY